MLSVPKAIFLFLIIFTSVILLVNLFILYNRYLSSEYFMSKNNNFFKVCFNKREKLKYQTGLNIEYYDKNTDYFVDIENSQTKCKFDIIYINSGAIFLIHCFPYFGKIEGDTNKNYWAVKEKKKQNVLKRIIKNKKDSKKKSKNIKKEKSYSKTKKIKNLFYMVKAKSKDLAEIIELKEENIFNIIVFPDEADITGIIIEDANTYISKVNGLTRTLAQIEIDKTVKYTREGIAFLKNKIFNSCDEIYK